MRGISPARKPRPRPRPARWELVVESFEGEFLWRMRERLLRSARHSIQDVEQRLLGCADGVWLGAERALQELLIPALSGTEPSRRAFASYLMADHELDAAWQALLDFMRGASAEQLVAVSAGIGLGERRSAELLCARGRARSLLHHGLPR